MENLELMKEELFCLKFELDTLAEVTIRQEAERWVPKLIHGVTENDHLDRYNFACTFAEGKNVLDIACGVGRGSFLMGTTGKAQSVLGCDLDENAIRYAGHRNGHHNVRFEVQNAEKFVKEQFFDLIISFETIEHLPDYEAFLANVLKSLKPGGRFIVSTPISHLAIDKKPGNPYHVQEWGFKEFQTAVSKFFNIDDIYVQLQKNGIINDKLKTDYLNSLPSWYDKWDFTSKMLRRLRIYKGHFPPPVYLTDWNSKTNYSTLEKFEGQYDITKLGKPFEGFQILVCSKR